MHWVEGCKNSKFIVAHPFPTLIERTFVVVWAGLVSPPSIQRNGCEEYLEDEKRPS